MEQRKPDRFEQVLEFLSATGYYANRDTVWYSRLGLWLAHATWFVLGIVLGYLLGS